MTNPTQRFFTMKVTGCKDCPILQPDQTYYGANCSYCGKTKNKIAGERLAKENYQLITPSCPMWAQSQEVEK